MIDNKVIAAFAVFIGSLLLWAILAVINRPELSGIVTFIQNVCAISWTAVALFIDPKAVVSGNVPAPDNGATSQQPSQLN